MASVPTNTTVTLYRRSDTSVDPYGQNLGAFEEVASYKAWVERTRYNEPQMDGETQAQDWLIILPGSVAIHDQDRILYRDEFYEISSDPAPQVPPGGSIHHTEGRMRPAVVPTLRDKAILTMRDQCVVTREVEGTFDPVSGTVTPDTETVYTGPCLVRSRDAYNRETNVIDASVTLQSYTAVVPFDITDVEDDDIFTATMTDDSRLLNRPLRVTGVNVTSNNASRVIFLEDNLD